MAKQQMSPHWGAELSLLEELQSSLGLFLISWTTPLSDLSCCQTQRAEFQSE